MLKCAISIVDISVQDFSAVFLNVHELHRHRLERAIENAWVVDIIPCVEKMVGPLELWELVDPKLLGICGQEVHECRVARPRLSVQCFALHVPDINILCVSLFPRGVLQLKAIVVDKVSLLDLDMWINDCDETAFRLFHLGFEGTEAGLRVVVGVEGEPLVITGLWCLLLCPKSVLDVHPKDVDWELGICEVSTSLSDHVGRDRTPFAEVKS